MDRELIVKTRDVGADSVGMYGGVCEDELALHRGREDNLEVDIRSTVKEATTKDSQNYP